MWRAAPLRRSRSTTSTPVALLAVSVRACRTATQRPPSAKVTPAAFEIESRRPVASSSSTAVRGTGLRALRSFSASFSGGCVKNATQRASSENSAPEPTDTS